MKIAALRLFNVKRFADRGIAIEGIGDGVNVLCAANEFGKSTSFEALHALFFQQHLSTGNDVRALRPYSGGNPLVEADIETAEGRFRITKQFYGGRSAKVADQVTGRLIAQADEAENFISSLVRGGTTGPAGLLWVRQGVTGIEKLSRSEAEGEKQVRASLLESVQGEVEAVTGGRRMAEIMATTEEALGRLVTPTGRPKASERYHVALEQRDRLLASERELAGEVAALRDALDKRVTATKRLAELDRSEDREQRKIAVEAAQAAFDAAKTRAEALRAAEAELRLVREQCEAATREHKNYADALKTSDVLYGRLSAAEAARAQALARREEAAAAIATARSASDLAESEAEEARLLLLRLDSALAAKQAAEQLQDLEQRLSAAEAARKGIEDGEAELALLKLPEQAISELQGLDVDIAKLTAVAEAQKPSVSIAYAEQAPTVSIDGMPLKDREPRSYVGQARLDIPGIGVIELRSNARDDGNAHLTKLESRREILLASMGVADLAAARNRQLEAQRKEGELRELKMRLSLSAPDGLAKLREEIAERRAAAGEALEMPADAESVRSGSAAAEERRRSTRLAMREAEPLQATAADAVIAAETALAAIRAESAQIEAVLGPMDGRSETVARLATRVSDLEGQRAQQAEAVSQLEADGMDLASAEASLKRLRSVEEAVEKEIHSLRETHAGLTAEIRARSEDAIEERWQETSDALSAVSARIIVFEREVALLQRLRSALSMARSHARDLYLKPVMAELQPLLELLFTDIKITFDENTLLPQKILRNGQEEEVERLSGGMREQLSVLTRLAFARLLAKDGRPAPVILDDALVYSDDDRIEKMFDALHRQSRDQQIIVFSCRQRAFQQLGGNVLRTVDWRPI